MKKRIYAQFERCMNCSACEVACQRENGGMGFIKVRLVADRYAVPLTCRQCDPAPCAMACPTRALSISGDEIAFDAGKCNGCTLCRFACPFGVMNFNPQSKLAAHCDLCARRRLDGKAPACMLTCPSSALHYGDLASYTLRERRRVSAEIVRARPLKRGGV